MSVSASYVCDICLAVNHAARLSCRACGTTPVMYSPIGKNTVYHGDCALDFAAVEVVVAYGAQRLESRRAHKVYFRTVKADYYATE